MNVNLQALTVDGAAGQVGKVGLAFTSDAQPEGLAPGTLSPVNATDFSVGLLGNDKRAANDQVVLRQAYRFGAEGGAVALTVAPVNPEVRVESRQVLSFGEERLVFRDRSRCRHYASGVVSAWRPASGGVRHRRRERQCAEPLDRNN